MTPQQKEIFKRLLAAKTIVEKKAIGVELVAAIPEDGRPHFNNVSILDIEGEVWVPIPKYENFYMASNFGRIKSLSRYRSQVDIILSNRIDEMGYLSVSLSENGKKNRIRIQCIIGMCFKGENKKKLDAHHLNGIKLDNREINIKYTTRSENIQHAWDTGLNKGGSFTYGTKRYNAVLTDEIVFKMRTMMKNGVRRRDIMKELGVAKHAYDNIQRGAWPHVTV